MIKFGRNIFFIRAPYNGPGTLAGSPGDLPDSFYEIFFTNFRLLLVNIFGTLFVGGVKIGDKYFSLEDCIIVVGSSWGIPGTLLTVFIEY